MAEGQTDNIVIRKQTLFNVVVLGLVLAAIGFFAYRQSPPEKLPLPVYPGNKCRCPYYPNGTGQVGETSPAAK